MNIFKEDGFPWYVVVGAIAANLAFAAVVIAMLAFAFKWVLS